MSDRTSLFQALRKSPAFSGIAAFLVAMAAVMGVIYTLVGDLWAVPIGVMTFFITAFVFLVVWYRGV